MALRERVQQQLPHTTFVRKRSEWNRQSHSCHITKVSLIMLLPKTRIYFPKVTRTNLSTHGTQMCSGRFRSRVLKLTIATRLGPRGNDCHDYTWDWWFECYYKWCCAWNDADDTLPRAFLFSSTCETPRAVRCGTSMFASGQALEEALSTATKRTMLQQQKKNTLPRAPGKTALCAPALHSVWLGDIPVYHGPPRPTWPVQDTTSRFVCCSFTKQYTKTMDSKGDSKSLSWKD
jgi:hypothetical protein